MKNEQQYKATKNWSSITSLCFGIASVFLWEFSLVPIVAVIFGVVGLFRDKRKWLAGIGVVLGIIFFIVRIAHGPIDRGISFSPPVLSPRPSTPISSPVSPNNVAGNFICPEDYEDSKTRDAALLKFQNDYIARNPKNTVNDYLKYRQSILVEEHCQKTLDNIKNNSLPPSPQDSPCTSFEYTRWSHCATDGTRSRVITAAYPDGCVLTDSAPSVQEQRCQYTTLNPTLTDVVNKMVGQIHNAPNQTITTKYFAGHPGDIFITTNKWKLSTDGTMLFLESTSKSRATGTVTDHIILADTNADFRPDTYSDNGDQWHSLASQDPSLVKNYTLVWAVASTYFGAYLLDY